VRLLAAPQVRAGYGCEAAWVGGIESDQVLGYGRFQDDGDFAVDGLYAAFGSEDGEAFADRVWGNCEVRGEGFRQSARRRR
jgi:hypothetical protein